MIYLLNYSGKRKTTFNLAIIQSAVNLFDKNETDQHREYERNEKYCMKDDKIMTLEEVASYLRLKPQTIYTWAQEKKIPAAKLGKEWRF